MAPSWAFSWNLIDVPFVCKLKHHWSIQILSPFPLKQVFEPAMLSLFPLSKKTTPWRNTEWVTDGITLSSSLCALALTNWHSAGTSFCCTCSTQWPSSLSLTLSLGSLLFPSGQVAALTGVDQVAKRAATLKDHSGLKIITLGNCFPAKSLLWISFFYSDILIWSLQKCQIYTVHP